MSAEEDSPAAMSGPEMRGPETNGSGPGAQTRRRVMSRSRRVGNPEARMSLIEHIRELRNRLIKALLAATLGAVAGWFIEPHVWHFVTAPYCRLPARYINPLGMGAAHGKGCDLVVTGLFDYFFLHLKLAIAIGVILSAPIWLYQLWAFIAPGLHARERRWAYFFGGSALPLFAVGGTLAYFAMSRGLGFLLHMLPNNVIPFITVSSYLGYAIAMLLIFGLAFEVPLVMVLLNVAGVLTHRRFAKWRRMIIFGVFAFAAVATPSPDMITMLFLAIPCVALVEAAELFSWANDRRRARRGIVYPGLSPEDVAEYGLDTEPVVAADFDDIEANS